MEHTRVKDMFEQALDLPVDQRRAFLESACGTQPRVRSRVEQDFPSSARLHATSSRMRAQSSSVRFHA